MRFRRFLFPTLLFACSLLSGCRVDHLVSITVTPGAGSETLTASGQTAQYKAIGTYRDGQAPLTTSDVTATVIWSVSNPGVATVSPDGLVTAAGSGKTAITAQSGGIVATSDITVTPPAPVALALELIPSSASATTASEKVQFVAFGDINGSGASKVVSDFVGWTSSNPSVATVDALGRATALAGGSTTITAASNGIAASATLSVSLAIPPPVTPSTLSIIPGTATATALGETTQFIVIGNLGTGGVAQDLTNKVRWTSSDISSVLIDQNGLATAVAQSNGPNTATITAEATTTAGSVITATSALTEILGAQVNLPLLTFYAVGNGAGSVTSSPTGLAGSSNSSCTSQPNCTGHFPLGTDVTLIAQPNSDSSFGGWSANCVPVQGSPNQCVVRMVNNETVGAVFNKP